MCQVFLRQCGLHTRYQTYGPYVSPESSIEKCLVKFLPVASHTGQMLFNAVITASEMSININKCRGHCITMPATCRTPITGVQAHIKEISPLAEWVPCGARTFRLVVVGGVNGCEDKGLFFSVSCKFCLTFHKEHLMPADDHGRAATQ